MGNAQQLFFLLIALTPQKSLYNFFKS